MLIDLHVHTNFSDGEMTPSETVRFLVEKGIRIAAITDHDSVNGIPEALEEAEKHDIMIIPGVELTTYHHDCELHILGLGIDYRNKLLVKELYNLRNTRYMRIKRMLSKLRESGIIIHDRDLFTREKSPTGASEVTLSYGRPHIAKILVEKGYVSNYKEAFERYIGDSCSSYIPKEKYPAVSGIKMLKKSGGVTALAHPEGKIDDEYVDLFIQNGLDGIEVYCSAHDEMHVYHYELMAKEKGLLPTTGSDLHVAKGYDNKLPRLEKNNGFLMKLAEYLPQISETVEKYGS